jgi:hypothetical protein
MRKRAHLVADVLMSELLDLALSKREDLVDILQPVGIARQREVDERDAERSDVLYREIRSGLIVSLYSL